MIIRNVEDAPERKLPGHGDALYRTILREEFMAVTELWQTRVDPGVTLPPHSHPDQEQVYFILRGSGTVIVGGERRSVRPGDAVYLPPMVPHGFQNDGDEPCVWIAFGATVRA